MSAERITLTRHILMQQQQHPGATGEFSILLSQIALAAKRISRRLRVAGLTGALGAKDEINVQGEIVQKLDEISNDAFLESFAYGELVSDMVSEEMDQPAQILGNADKGKYVVFVDPLDGSSNIDVDVTIGSIFSIHRRPAGQRRSLKRGAPPQGPRPGCGRLCPVWSQYHAGLYRGGWGARFLPLTPVLVTFFCRHEDIHIPGRGSTYSINEGRRNDWFPETRHYVEYLQKKDKDSGPALPPDATWAPLSRIFIAPCSKAASFSIPPTPKNTNGKLRLMYEAAPMALVIEQAGGRASNGRQPILDPRSRGSAPTHTPSSLAAPRM